MPIGLNRCWPRVAGGRLPFTDPGELVLLIEFDRVLRAVIDGILSEESSPLLRCVSAGGQMLSGGVKGRAGDPVVKDAGDE